MGHAADTIFRYLNNGGGGWGDPLHARARAREARRARRLVTIEGALRDYGVVVVGDPENDPEGLTVDAEGTAGLRS